MSGSISASTVALASMAMAAAGTAMTVKGQMDQQAAAGAQANYMAQMQRNNQAVAKMQADAVRTQGETDVQRQRNITAQTIGKQTAALAGQGTDMAGSPTDILGDTARAGETDALTIRSNAARTAWGYEAAGAGYGANAALNESFRPSYLGAGASLLSGASSLSDKWSKFQWPGGNNGFGDSSWVGTGGRTAVKDYV